MPANLVKTARDERLWGVAKRKMRGKKGAGWGYAVRVFENMKNRVGNPKE